MQLVEIGESVKVRSDIGGGRIVPLMIRRGENVYRVKQVNASWEDRDGSGKTYYFSVTTQNGDILKLSLKSEDMLWRIESVILEG
jgi:hypothetical protein